MTSVYPDGAARRVRRVGDQHLSDRDSVDQITSELNRGHNA